MKTFQILIIVLMTGINIKSFSQWTTYSPMDVRSNGIWQGTVRANTNDAGQYSSFALMENSQLRWAIYNHPGHQGALFIANGWGQDKITLTQDGKLGIGTITPVFDLEISGHGQKIRQPLASSHATFRLYNDQDHLFRSLHIDYAGSAFSQSLLTNGPAGESGSIATTGAYPLSLGTNNTSRMVISAAGNIGVGTVDPQYNFDIAGFGLRVRNPFTGHGGYTTFRVQGPDYTNGLEMAFFGNNNITGDLNWSYGGGPGSGALVNVNPKPLILGTNNQGRLLIDGAGNVGIGTTSPDQKLTVKGIIHTEEVRVDMTVPGPDYVFEPDYNLTPLDEVAAYIREHKHLPEVPSAKEMEEEGLNLKEMNLILLRKVEELTLHLIEQQKKIDELNKRSVSPDPSGKKVEELTLHLIEQQKEIAELRERSVSQDPSGKKVEELTLHLIELERKYCSLIQDKNNKQ